MTLPQNGFYVHYKHHPAKGFEHVYEVVGTALHSDFEEKTYLVVYRPMYENAYLSPANFFVRPLEIFLENVVVDGKTVPRFTRITDETLLTQLEKVKDEMYGKGDK